MAEQMGNGFLGGPTMDVTATPDEINILDGVTSTAAELNILDGVTATAAELNILDGVTATAAELNILDGVTATAAELNANNDASGRMVTLAGSTSITVADHGERMCLLTGTGAAYTQTLPAAAGTGVRFRFVVGAVNTSNHIIAVANGSDVMYGQIVTCSTGDSPDLAQPWPTAADSDTITLDGTTSGGVAIGDYIDIVDIAANQWLVIGFTNSSGTEVTPFSAAVA